MERILIEGSHGNAKARIHVTTQKKSGSQIRSAKKSVSSELASSVSLVLQGHRLLGRVGQRSELLTQADTRTKDARLYG